MEKTYKTKSLDGEFSDYTILENHLEIEHEISYYYHCLDFVSLETLELVHEMIHSAYFAGIKDYLKGILPNNATYKTSTVKATILPHYPFSDLDADLEMCGINKIYIY